MHTVGRIIESIRHKTIKLLVLVLIDGVLILCPDSLDGVDHLEEEEGGGREEGRRRKEEEGGREEEEGTLLRWQPANTRS